MEEAFKYSLSGRFRKSNDLIVGKKDKEILRNLAQEKADIASSSIHAKKNWYVESSKPTWRCQTACLDKWNTLVWNEHRRWVCFKNFNLILKILRKQTEKNNLPAQTHACRFYSRTDSAMLYDNR